ncbi:hypothetical protein PIROE2DRAFT_60957 [Piromyces sp. E2]|nr:hypothetical protein PIROE2DRAFT_60957 [Piromyces sp. E2]|eukprot:OUM63991.1 hypothetical protein PIROE2DRAFT_60957 [Piromyces sp. E2]
MCREGKKDVIKWLLTMDINSTVKDEFGMTALMYAAEKPNLLFVVKHFVARNDTRCLNIRDNHGENALFHSLYNKNAFVELLKSDIDINQVNNNNETILLYCCKYSIYEPIPLITDTQKINGNIVDNEERTAVMYLAEKARNTEIPCLYKYTDFDYINKKNESILSIVIKNIYTIKSVNEPHTFCKYSGIIVMLNNLGCNLNLPIDDDENTALMVFMIKPDYPALNYMLKRGQNLDLSLKNKYGENASSLFFKCINDSSLYPYLINNPTFDFDYIDRNNKNSMLMLGSLIQPQLVNSVLENNINLINEVNNKNENALIIAIKYNNGEAVAKLLECGINVNQQDYIGNTALYYAIDLKNLNYIKVLMDRHADIHRRNVEGKSPLEYAHELGEKSIINLLNNPESVEEGTIFPTEKNSTYLRYKQEMDEYLYPCLQNTYSKIKLSDSVERMEKVIYDSELSKKK